MANLTPGGRQFMQNVGLFDETTRALAHNDLGTLENLLEQARQQNQITEEDEFHIHLYVLNYSQGIINFKIK